MTGYVRNDTADNIADGKTINASDFDGEFNAIQVAFNSSTGHKHDGTTGGGALISYNDLTDLPTSAGATELNDLSDAVVTATSIGLGVSGALSSNSVKVGLLSSANTDTVAIGYSAQGTTSATNSVVIGSTASASATNTVAVGYSADSTGLYATAIGSNAQATNNYTVSVGASANASGSDSTAIGVSAEAGSYSVSLGRLAGNKNYSYAVSIGRDSSANGNNAIAIGSNSSASSSGIAIGSSVSAASDQVKIGGTSVNRLTVGNILDTSIAPSGYLLSWGGSSFSWVDPSNFGGSKTIIDNNYSLPYVSGKSTGDLLIATSSGNFIIYDSSLSASATNIDGYGIPGRFLGALYGSNNPLPNPSSYGNQRYNGTLWVDPSDNLFKYYDYNRFVYEGYQGDGWYAVGGGGGATIHDSAFDLWGSAPSSGELVFVRQNGNQWIYDSDDNNSVLFSIDNSWSKVGLKPVTAYKGGNGKPFSVMDDNNPDYKYDGTIGFDYQDSNGDGYGLYVYNKRRYENEGYQGDGWYLIGGGGGGGGGTSSLVGATLRFDSNTQGFSISIFVTEVRLGDGNYWSTNYLFISGIVTDISGTPTTESDLDWAVVASDNYAGAPFFWDMAGISSSTESQSNGCFTFETAVISPSLAVGDAFTLVAMYNDLPFTNFYSNWESNGAF